MSKEEQMEYILDGYESHRVMTDYERYEDLWPKECVMQAMEEYAKIEAIGFAEWKDKNVMAVQKGDKYTQRHNDKTYTYDQLYTLYQQSKQK